MCIVSSKGRLSLLSVHISATLTTLLLLPTYKQQYAPNPWRRQLPCGLSHLLTSYVVVLKTLIGTFSMVLTAWTSTPTQFRLMYVSVRKFACLKRPLLNSRTVNRGLITVFAIKYEPGMTPTSSDRIIGLHTGRPNTTSRRASNPLNANIVSALGIFGYKQYTWLWAGVQNITNYKQSSAPIDTDDVTLPDRLNEFYARFDRNNPDSTSPRPPAETNCDPPFTVRPDNIVRILSRLSILKAPGPDQITPRLLRNCASQLADVFAHIFNWSLRVCRLPKCYKDSIIVPVPKKKAIKSLNHYRPVALTSQIAKCFEKLLMNFMKSLLHRDLDHRLESWI